VTFFVGALVCHGEIARDRPPVQHLTSFYLWIAVGGVLGGALSGLIAPTIFPGFVEYPLAIVAGAALLPRHPDGATSRLWADVAFAVAVGAIVVGALAAATTLSVPDVVAHGIAFGPAALLCYSAVRRRLRFSLAMAGVLLAGVLPIGLSEQPLFAGRDFFGDQPGDLLHQAGTARRRPRGRRGGTSASSGRRDSVRSPSSRGWQRIHRCSPTTRTASEATAG
jgi:hypothetical protein